MGIVDSRCGNHQPVGMEGGNRDGSRSVPQETRVGFKVGYGLTIVYVEDLHTVSLRATIDVSMFQSVYSL